MGRGGGLAVRIGLVGAMACSPRPPPTTTRAAPELAGRTRTVTFECPGPAPRPASFPMSCGGYDLRWPDVDPRPPAPGLPSPTYGPRRADEPCVYGVSICGLPVAAAAGSKALACGDADGRRHGPVEVVAADGSLLVQGFCAHGEPAGAWLWWQRGHLAASRTFPITEAEGLSYVKPDRYAYRDAAAGSDFGYYRLVPVAVEAP